MTRMRLATAGLALFISAGASSALAAPLDKDACAGLKTEHGALVAKGLEADMAKGPEWAKANLPPDRLNEIGRLIDLNEQLAFRCGEMTVTRPDGQPLLKKKEPPVRPKETVAGEQAGAATATADTGTAPAKPKKKKGAAKAPAPAPSPGLSP
jgi:hypothetical protein